MGNCLKTQLKEVVNNDNLPILGYNKCKVKVDSAGTLATFKTLVAAKFILLDGTWVSSGTRELEADANTAVYAGPDTVIPDGDGQIYCTILYPRYSCYHYGNLIPVSDDKPIELSGFKFTDPSLLPNNCVVNMMGTGITPATAGSRLLSGLNYAPLEKVSNLTVSGFKFAETVDVTQLGAGGYLTYLNMSNCNWNLTGSFDNLGKSNFTPTYFPTSKDVSIDLVNYVNNNRSAGRTSGSRNLKFIGSMTVKVSGTVIPLEAKADNVVAWTADSITLDGEPLDSYLQ